MKVEFDELAHKYYVDGKMIPMSVTQLIASTEKEFPRLMLAERVAKKREVPVEFVLKEWDLKGQMSLDYGNALHRTIECYEKYNAIPKGYFANMVAERYKELGYSGVVSELVVFTKDLTVAGTIDIFDPIDYGEKTCIIRDFKTFGEMETKKKKKTSLQLSVYEKILNQWGWTVIKREMLWWDGQKFRVFDMPFDNKANDLI